jgi:hypothetical protein
MDPSYLNTPQLPPEIILAIVKRFLSRKDTENTWPSLNAFIRASPVIAEYARENRNTIASLYTATYRKHSKQVERILGESEIYTELPNGLKHGYVKRYEVVKWYDPPEYKQNYLSEWQFGVMIYERTLHFTQIQGREPVRVFIDRRPKTTMVIKDERHEYMQFRSIVTNNLGTACIKWHKEYVRGKDEYAYTLSRNDEWGRYDADLPKWDGDGTNDLYHGEVWEAFYEALRNGKWEEWKKENARARK